jgi:uncharacterized membrane protein YfcA
MLDAGCWTPGGGGKQRASDIQKRIVACASGGHYRPMHYLLAGIVGLIGGITSGLFGVGGGVVMVPAMLLLLSPPIRDIKQAIGTSLLVIVPTALMGTWKHAQHGNVDWRIALALVPTAIAGGYLGAYFTTLIHADNLKKAFGGFLIFVGARLLFFK